jgi:hypothetical protein
MIKKLSSLGNVLSKKELLSLHGGGGDCVSHTGGSCSYSHNYCQYNYPGDYADCMNSVGCGCYLSGPSGPRKPIIIIDDGEDG